MEYNNRIVLFSTYIYTDLESLKSITFELYNYVDKFSDEDVESVEPSPRNESFTIDDSFVETIKSYNKYTLHKHTVDLE